MRKRSPGSRLAVRIPEHWPRWINCFLFLLAGAVCIAPSVWFALDRTYTTYGLLEVVFAILGAISLVLFLRLSVLALLVGDTIVEISHEPAPVGSPLHYYILQRRRASTVRSLTARLILRRQTRRGGAALHVELDLPLAETTVEPDGRRKIEGSLVVPEVPASTPYAFQGRLEWLVHIRIRFVGGFEHEEDRPIEVVTSDK